MRAEKKAGANSSPGLLLHYLRKRKLVNQADWALTVVPITVVPVAVVVEIKVISNEHRHENPEPKFLAPTIVVNKSRQSTSL